VTFLSILLVLASSGAQYDVRLAASDPPRLHVIADLPVAGDEISMTRTRPGDVPEILKEGWPALVRNLHVSDANGRAVATTRNGPAGWRLSQPLQGRVRVTYDVDYTLLEKLDWPARREAAFSDPAHIVVIGRSLFITTAQSGASTVEFNLPRRWRVATPWQQKGKSFTVASTDDLVDNLIVMTTEKVETVVAGDLEVLMVPLGHWRDQRPAIRRVLRGSIPQLAALMPLAQKERYLAVLLPLDERGAESFRRSMAMTTGGTPSGAAWQNTIAHEIFHLWNGWSLKPADYATSQWFHEGITEYAANLATVRSGVVNDREFLEMLSQHVRNYRKLPHPLGAKVTGKGPPLYSAGALTAFAWDGLIRDATNGQRDLSMFLRNIWKRTSSGAKPYERADLRAALADTADFGWEAFFAAHIDGTEPLPLREIFGRAGLRLTGSGDAERLEHDPAASSSAKALWRAIITPR